MGLSQLWPDAFGIHYGIILVKILLQIQCHLPLVQILSTNSDQDPKKSLCHKLVPMASIPGERCSLASDNQGGKMSLALSVLLNGSRAAQAS